MTLRVPRRLSPTNVPVDVAYALDGQESTPASVGRLTVPHQDFHVPGARPFCLSLRTTSFAVVAEEVESLDPQEWRPIRLVTTPGTRRMRYRLHALSHPHARAFARAFSRGGVEELLAGDERTDTPSPQVTEHPEQLLRSLGYDRVDLTLIANAGAARCVEFQSTAPNAVYNWELFYHVPLLVARRLSETMRFADADRWLRFVFDPTFRGAALEAGLSPAWRTAAFCTPHGEARPLSAESGERVAADAFLAQVEAMEADPFDPHHIARLRPSAYMKAAVRQYLDNLLAWGDYLFAQYTAETIAEASTLYVLAARILGARPEVGVESSSSYTVDSAGDGHTDLEFLETFGGVAEPAHVPDSVRRQGSPDLVSFSEAFCVPINDKVLSYWDTVADRLFKVRHCLDITGVHRDVALFAPPIDPGALVRAAAAGLDVAAVAAGLSAPASPYRFRTLVSRASQLNAVVQALGNALLSATEKRDSEGLQKLRATHERQVLALSKAVRERQVDEAAAAIAAAERRRTMVSERHKFHKQRDRRIKQENKAANKEAAALVMDTGLAALYAVAGAMAAVPAVAGGVAGIGPFAKVETGGTNLNNVAIAAAHVLTQVSGVLKMHARQNDREAGLARRDEEWKHAAEQADAELKIVEQEIAVASVRLEVAKRELAVLEAQIEHASEAFDYLTSKFSSEALYGWMVGRLRVLYGRAHTLARRVAHEAEAAARREAWDPDNLASLRVGAWDAGRDGLLAGEELQVDLLALEQSFLDQARRRHEIALNIPLSELSPEALITFRLSGSTTIPGTSEVPVLVSEDWLNLHYPGQTKRRIRSVSFSVVAATGSFGMTPVHVALGGDAFGPTAVALSHGQSDFGVFEPSLTDERYMPFEGAELAESTWTFTALGAAFDHGLVHDIIMHVRYESDDTPTASETETPFPPNGDVVRLFTARADFPADFLAYKASSGTPNQITLNVSAEMIPKLRPSWSPVSGTIVGYAKLGEPYSLLEPASQEAFTGGTSAELPLAGGTPDDVQDILIVVKFSTVGT